MVGIQELVQKLKQFLINLIHPKAPPKALYDQILLLGDSITEFAENQENGFNWAPAVRNGKLEAFYWGLFLILLQTIFDVLMLSIEA
jgi:hypothetical protein